MKWGGSRIFPDLYSNPPPPVPRSKPRRSSSGRARDGERKVRGTRVSSKGQGKCGIGPITRGPGSGGESLVPFGHTDVSGCGFGLHPLTAPRGAREAGDRSTLALASTCEAGSEAARPLVAPDGRPAGPRTRFLYANKVPSTRRTHEGTHSAVSRQRRLTGRKEQKLRMRTRVGVPSSSLAARPGPTLEPPPLGRAPESVRTTASAGSGAGGSGTTDGGDAGDRCGRSAAELQHHDRID